MTQRLQNRKTAALITLCVVVLSTLLGAGISLGRLRAEAADVFYHGGKNSWNGIERDLYDVVGHSENLLTVAGRYMNENDVRIDAVERGIDAVYRAYTPKDKHAAAEQLRGAVSDLDAMMKMLYLDDSDEVYREKLVANIESCYLIIEQSNYNQVAGEFNQKLKAFPANVLSGIIGVEPLELYE